MNVAIPEPYGSLSRGVMDDIFMATAGNVPPKRYEVAKAHFVLGERTIFSAPLAISLKEWEQPPEDVKKAFLDASYETAQWSVTELDRILQDTYKKSNERGQR